MLIVIYSYSAKIKLFFYFIYIDFSLNESPSIFLENFDILLYIMFK